MEEAELPLPENHGKPWTVGDYRVSVLFIFDGNSAETLARALKRRKSAVLQHIARHFSYLRAAAKEENKLLTWNMVDRWLKANGWQDFRKRR